MKSYGIIWPRPGEFAMEELEVRDPGAGEVTIEAECSLISPGTDRMRLLDQASNAGRWPQRPGYSFAGRVYAAGPDVDGLKVGDRIAANAPYAKHVTMGTRQVLPVADNVDAASAVFMNLGTVATHGARRAQIEVGESVAIIGQGLVGLLTMQMARMQGGVPIIALDLVDSRLERSRAWGADIVVNPADEGAIGALKTSLGGAGPDVVIEVTGNGDAINLAFSLVRRLGRVVILGSGSHETLANFNRDVHMAGVTVIGAQTVGRPLHDSRPGIWTWRDDGRSFLELLHRGRFEVASLITQRVSVHDNAQVFELLKSADPSLIGAVIDWP